MSLEMKQVNVGDFSDQEDSFTGNSLVTHEDFI